MVLPIVTSLSREVFPQTPQMNEEAALALGATKWEMIRTAVIPYGRPGHHRLGHARPRPGAGRDDRPGPDPRRRVHHQLRHASRTAATRSRPTSPTRSVRPSDIGRGALIASGLVLFVDHAGGQHDRPGHRVPPARVPGSCRMSLLIATPSAMPPADHVRARSRPVPGSPPPCSGHRRRRPRRVVPRLRGCSRCSAAATVLVDRSARCCSSWSCSASPSTVIEGRRAARNRVATSADLLGVHPGPAAAGLDRRDAARARAAPGWTATSSTTRCATSPRSTRAAAPTTPSSARSSRSASPP